MGPKAERLARILGVTAPAARANLRYHALVGTGICVGPDAQFWFHDGKACPTVLAVTREVPEGTATGELWRINTVEGFWHELTSLLREMTEDEVREAMLGAAT
jgi:hypothetical protein